MWESSYSAPSGNQKYAKIRYHFVARNPNELSVQQGDVLEVLEDGKQWWRLRSRSGQEGHVPYSILQEVGPEEYLSRKVPVVQGPPNPFCLGAPKRLETAVQTNQNTPVQPSIVPSASVPVTGDERAEKGKTLQDKDSRSQVTDELLQRITASKSQPQGRNFRPERPAGTPTPLTFESQPWEVTAWLNTKGFSRPTVNCLGILTGAQLFSLSKDELKAVCGDEGSRVYSQVTVQKSQLERIQGTSELQEIMRRRQEEVDAFTYD
ncbi:epidermal growth factor receptor kinase substrate 8-like protein 2 isoform X2 [Denticeps clupeoides]|uniref:epidermal growth factor receptor kinase substrate 8-like protein 2 isoform X2 n=1 Tax=Denticeps clupeoides TaxID=299321 RepID=UPI0010A45FE6|nr:epidermal growth factor receptor kinase substrate 8-like protein 2 isoform X2 [Denticeps clupeoides]